MISNFVNDDISAGDCSEYLQTLSNPDIQPITPPFHEKQLKEICKECEKINDNISKQEIESIPNIYCQVFSSLLQAKSSDEMFLSLKGLLILLSLPGASAMGCHSYVIFNSFYVQFNKLLNNLLKYEDSLNRNEKNNHDDSFDEQKDEIQNFEGLEFTTENLSQTTRSSQRCCNTNSKINPIIFRDLCMTLSTKASIFVSITDEDLINNFSDLFLNILYFATIKNGLLNSADYIKEVIVKFSNINNNTLLSLHRSVCPMLSMNLGRNKIIPDNLKIRKNCYMILKDVYITAIKEAFENFAKFQISKTNDLNDSHLNISMNESFEDIENDINETKSISEEIPFTFLCFIGLFQRMMISCPDKAPFRSIVAETSVSFINELYTLINQDIILSDYLQLTLNRLLLFLNKLSKSNKVQLRAFSLEVTCLLLSTNSIWEKVNETSRGLTLLNILVGRCEDSSPSVRLRAISAFLDIIENYGETSHEGIINAFYDLMMGMAPDSSLNLFEIIRRLANDEKPLIRSKAIQVFGICLTKKWYKIISISVELSNVTKKEEFSVHISDDDLTVFFQALRDESVSVRKQSLTATVLILKYHGNNSTIQLECLQNILPLSLDPEASIVLKLAVSMQEMIFDDIEKWFSESKKLKVEIDDSQIFGWELISNIFNLGLQQLFKTLVSSMLKQGLLTVETKGNSSKSFTKLMEISKFACSLNNKETHENKQNNLIQNISSASWILLEILVNQSNLRIADSTGKCIVLEELLHQGGSISFVIDHFKKRRDQNICFGKEDLRILKVLEKLTVNLSKHEIDYMTSQIDNLLHSFTYSSELLSIAISVRYNISKSLVSLLYPKDEYYLRFYDDVQLWSSGLYRTIYCLIYTFIFNKVPEEKDIKFSMNSLPITFLSTIKENPNNEDIISIMNNSLFLLGELVMLGFKMDESDPKANKTSVRSKNSSSGLLDYSGAPDQDTFRLIFSTNIIDLVKVLMGKELPITNGIETSRKCSPSIRAISFVTMGKMCIRDNILARDLVKVFIREINSCYNIDSEVENIEISDKNQVSVRLNALLILGDLCVRHTHLVDHYIDSIACCLQDKNSLIRKNALLLITQLLVQDFLKWKGLLLYRFLILTVDEDPEISYFAKDILDRTLSKKYYGLLENHVSEVFIILNKCIEHPIYSAISWATSNESIDSSNISFDQQDQLDPITKAFHQATNLTRGQRFMIYNFITRNLTDEQRIQITAKLVNDILASAVDNSKRLLPDRSKPHLLSAKKISKDGLTPFETAIEEVFIFLRSPNLKIGTKKSLSSEENIQDESENQATSVNNAIAAAKFKILKTLSSQHLVSHLIPVVVSLKHCLEATRSPLQGALMEYLLSLVKSHKTEVDQALQNDPTLKAELDYDLRQFEKSKKEAQKAKLENSASKIIRVSPYLDINNINPSTIKKPSLKSAGKSSLTNSKPKEVPEIYIEDPISRLMGKELHIDELEKNPISSGLKNQYSSMKSCSISNNSRRRSWGVVVGELNDDVENTNALVNMFEPPSISKGAHIVNSYKKSPSHKRARITESFTKVSRISLDGSRLERSSRVDSLLTAIFSKSEQPNYAKNLDQMFDAVASKSIEPINRKRDRHAVTDSLLLFK